MHVTKQVVLALIVVSQVQYKACGQTTDNGCVDLSKLCSVRLSTDSNFCNKAASSLCDKTCVRCATTTDSTTTTTVTVDTTTTTQTPTTTETRTTTTTKPTRSTTSTTTSTTTTTPAPTTTTASTASPSSVSTRRVTKQRITRKPTNLHSAVKIVQDQTNSNYNMKVSVVLLGHIENKTQLLTVGKAVKEVLNEPSAKVLQFAEESSELGQSGNFSAIRLTRITWNVRMDSVDVAGLIQRLKTAGTLGDDIDMQLYQTLPEAQVYNRDDFQSLTPGSDTAAAGKSEQVTKQTEIDGDDWKVIGAAIGVGVALIVIMIFTVYWQRRRGHKQSLEIGKAADYGVKYTARTEL